MREIKETSELQQIILEIQKKIHAFCEKNDIPYSLSGGTCIGAVRHKGFIPWDDDIDLFLTRENYDRFLDAIEKEPIEGVLVATFHNRSRFFLPFAKAEDVRTEVKELINHPGEIGVNIDLFPLSGLPNSLRRRKLYLFGARVFRGMLALKRIKPVGRRSQAKNLILIFGRIALCWLPLKALLHIFDRFSKLCDYDHADYICEIFSGVTKPFPRECMRSAILMPFENQQFRVMSGYDAYLRATYGDYMQLPPPEKRITHHAFKAYWKHC